MSKVKFGVVFLIAVGMTALVLSGCGNKNSISSLTESDSTTTSVPAESTVSQSGVQTVTPQAVEAQPVDSVPETTTSSVILPQVADAVPAQKADLSFAETVEEEDFVPAGEGNTAVTNKDVNFRTAPTTDEDNIIDEISEGTEVTVLAAEDGWLKVQIGDDVGYLKAEYVD